MPVSINIDARQLDSVAAILAGIPDKIATAAVPRAVNRVGDMTYTQVARGLAEQTGAQQKRVRARVSKFRATKQEPVFRIVARDQFMSLKDFRPRQTRKGVTASPWGKRRAFRSTFFGPGQHVYRRVGKGRLPIERLYGPAIPRELVRGQTRALVEGVVQQHLGPRIVHEVGVEIARAGKRGK